MDSFFGFAIVLIFGDCEVEIEGLVGRGAAIGCGIECDIECGIEYGIGSGFGFGRVCAAWGRYSDWKYIDGYDC